MDLPTCIHGQRSAGMSVSLWHVLQHRHIGEMENADADRCPVCYRDPSISKSHSYTSRGNSIAQSQRFRVLDLLQLMLKDRSKSSINSWLVESWGCSQ